MKSKARKRMTYTIRRTACLTLTLAGLAVLLVAGVGAQAASPEGLPETIAPAARQALTSLPDGQRLAVIVVFEDQADLDRIVGMHRAERLAGAIRRLQATAQSTQRAVQADLARYSVQSVGQVTYFWIFNGMALSATADVIAELASRPDVRSITLDRTFAAPKQDAVPAVPILSGVEENLLVIQASDVWDKGFQGQGIVVASMDSGVSGTHPDLSAQWRGGSNSWFDPYGEHPTSPADLNGHGTATMGVMVGGDGGGTAIGVAPQAEWIAVKIFDDRDQAASSAIHQGFQWLLDPDGNPSTPDAPHVVNNSWGIGSAICDLAFQLDLQALRAAGIVPIFSAGNQGPDEATSTSPANNPEALAVGATDNDDGIYAKSSQGPAACGESETVFPEVVAPGVNIRTTWRYGLYQSATGTSVAAPHVAGSLALLLDAFPNLTVAQQEAALMRSAVDLGSVGPDNTFGQGRLDVLAAHDLLAESVQLSIKVDHSDPVSAGMALTYTLVVTNAGPATASGVTVTDDLPVGMVYGEARGQGWVCGHAGGHVTCTLPALAIGVAPKITLAVTAPTEGGIVTNTVHVSSQQVDLVLDDNWAQTETEIQAGQQWRLHLPVVWRH